MKLSQCTHDTVFHVAANMRAIDREEIYGLRWEENPFVIAQEVMAQRNFAWVAWAGDRPAAVLGGAPLHPGVWQMFMFATDDFPKLGLGMTRFAIRTCVPTLFGQLGAHRLQADSHIKHVEAHAWLRCIGARVESVRRGFGRDGSDYLHFVLSKPVDSQQSTA